MTNLKPCVCGAQPEMIFDGKGHGTLEEATRGHVECPTCGRRTQKSFHGGEARSEAEAAWNQGEIGRPTRAATPARP